MESAVFLVVLHVAAVGEDPVMVTLIWMVAGNMVMTPCSQS